MFSKIFKKILKHKLLTGIILLLIIGGGYFGYQKLKSNDSAVRYAIAAVEKGTLIVSVSGSGQVSAFDQIDLKPKVSGDVVYIGVKKDQELKAGTLIVQIGASDAQSAISDAEIALESAKIKLEELLSPPDAQSLLQAEYALAQAERDLERAKKNSENIQADAEETLADAYEEGYSDVSTSFFKLTDYMKDLRDILGTEKNEQENISSYKLILGENSLFIQKFLSDYYRASDFYNKNFTFFREVYRDDARDIIYKLISDTLETTKAISQVLESSRHMYDAIVASDYTKYSITAAIDKMQPKIESDLSSVFSTITSLQQTIDTIDNTVQDTPDKIKDAELALNSTEAKFEEAKQSLEELKAGPDSLDIRTQQNIVAQKEAALIDAKEKLASCFIRAPFDGIVAKINVKKGDSVSSGTALATLITQQKIAEITLNEIDVAKIKVGQKVTVTFDAIENFSITGEVAEVDTVGTISQGVVTYNIKIGLDTQDERVKPGMSLSAFIVTDVKQNALLVSNSAVKQQGDMAYVEVVDENLSNSASANVSGVALTLSPRIQQVEVGLSNDTQVEIVSGLEEGDRVITQTISSGTTSQSQFQQNTNLRMPGFTGGL